MLSLNLKKILAKKMGGKPKPKTVDEYDAEMTKGKMPKRYSIYRGNSKTPRGLTNYINDMLEAERQGKFKFDSRHVKPT